MLGGRRQGPPGSTEGDHSFPREDLGPHATAEVLPTATAVAATSVSVRAWGLVTTTPKERRETEYETA